jgi:dipeptidase D
MTDIKDLKPQILWKYFDEIRKIPRCSKHEEKIRKYVEDFAKLHKLSYKTDDIGNIVISKPATKGMEKKPIVILQGHLDMVCEKNSDKDFDFLTDPIQLKKNGDILTADGTTLGADNGIGIAASLAILEDKTIQHGPLECLFTIDEETGLTGAFALKSDMLTGKILLNLDSEDWGVLTVGCAGGGDSKIKLPIKKQESSKNLENILLNVSGLRGGHSGVDAHEQRGNAIKVVSRILWKASNKFDFHLADIKGGDKHNAIPRESYAILSIDKKNLNAFNSLVATEAKDILEEIKPIDPGLKVDIKKAETISSVFDKKSQDVLLHLLHALPHGVDKMSYDIKGLVETSTNLATVIVKDDKVHIGLSSRSSIMSALKDFRNRIKATALLAGAQVFEEEPYPGWKPDLDSKILNLSKQIYKEMYKKEPVVEAIHAGLECGIIGEKFDGMDMISIGPTIKYPHSPEEQVHINTVNEFYKFILEILKQV